MSYYITNDLRMSIEIMRCFKKIYEVYAFYLANDRVVRTFENMEMNEKDILRGLDEQLRQWLLVTRANERRTATCGGGGRCYELLLLRNEHIVSAPFEGKKRITGAHLSEALGLDEETAERVRHYLRSPSHEMMAMLLAARERTLLFAPMPGLSSGESVGFLLDLDAAATARVLAHSFSTAVAMDDEMRRLANTPMRETDEQVYMLVCQLLCLWRRLVMAKDVGIRDRRELSRQLMLMGRLVLALLGEDCEYEGELFPFGYPFVGTYRTAPAAWMMLCLGCGLVRKFSSAFPRMHFAPERERLLPMLEIPAGNRTALPSEWLECSRVAEQYDMLFETRRQRDAVRVVLCPMTPLEEKSSFYSMRAGIELHARLQEWAHGQNGK